MTRSPSKSFWPDHDRAPETVLLPQAVLMTLSVMITTKGRIGSLRRTCRVLQQLNPSPLEVLITMDGCTDDTVEVVRPDLPETRLFVNEIGLGSVA